VNETCSEDALETCFAYNSNTCNSMKPMIRQTQTA